MIFDEERMISIIKNVKYHLPSHYSTTEQTVVLLFQFQVPRQALPFQGRQIDPSSNRSGRNARAYNRVAVVDDLIRRSSEIDTAEEY
jgi:hypothetical protein